MEVGIQNAQEIRRNANSLIYWNFFCLELQTISYRGAEAIGSSTCSR